jgi:hypothetical protein
MLITSSRKEYLLKLEDLSSEHHTSQYLSTVIEEVIGEVGTEKFVAIISDNAANVAGARRIISQNHPSILNIRCIAHCINLISSESTTYCNKDISIRKKLVLSNSKKNLISFYWFQYKFIDMF